MELDFDKGYWTPLPWDDEVYAGQCKIKQHTLDTSFPFCPPHLQVFQTQVTTKQCVLLPHVILEGIECLFRRAVHTDFTLVLLQIAVGFLHIFIFKQDLILWLTDKVSSNNA